LTAESSTRTPGTLSNFAHGLRLSLSKPYLAVALWLIQLLLASALILPIGNTLHALLDRDPAADKMVANPDYGWWETVRREHPDLLGNFPELATGLLTSEGISWSELPKMRGIGAAAFSLALLAIVVHAFALGGMLGTIREPSASLVTFGREGMRRMPAFLVFTFAAFAAAFAAYRWIYVESGEALRSRVRELPSEPAALMVTAARLLALLVVLAMIKLLVDSVRAVWVARPDLPPVSRFFFGIGGALSRPLRLLGILGLYTLSTAALYVFWLVLDPSAGGEARFALAPLILAQQVFVFVRLLLKVGYYAGISEALTRAPSPEYSYVPASAQTAGANESPIDGP
jgi:AbgT putative transporter family